MVLLVIFLSVGRLIDGDVEVLAQMKVFVGIIFGRGLGVLISAGICVVAGGNVDAFQGRGVGSRPLVFMLIVFMLIEGVDFFFDGRVGVR